MRERGGPYYTRTRRVNGHQSREYIGGGIRGQEAASVDAEERVRRERLGQIKDIIGSSSKEIDSTGPRTFDQVSGFGVGDQSKDGGSAQLRAFLPSLSSTGGAYFACRTPDDGQLT